ncbi:alanine racemase [Occultella kanbiaonis]|uniref:alanine racemase n=1 Tax=Occultella kanbiaonis TaxID=2675754 RepID=UPI0012B97097|nr:alanine racemase [Occultella kanbiaonis]
MSRSGAVGRPAPWRDATRSLSAPLAVVDLDTFDINARDLIARAGDTPVRLATKSVRVRHLVHRALDVHGFSGVMAYSLAEALWLAEDGISDVLVGYPSVDTASLVALASNPAAREAITLMVDDVAQIALIERALIRAGSPGGPAVQVCIDVDASLRIAPLGVHLGVRRSPLRSPADAVALARAVERTGRVRVRGVMFYDAQVAGLGEAGLRGVGVRILKRASLRELAGRRPAVVAALEDHLGRQLLVNAGGSGSVHDVAPDPTVTEVTAGSGLFCPTLFDDYSGFTARPAAFFGLDVVRRPAARIATAFGGGYAASGPPGKDRLPRAVDGSALLRSEGAGEVQTPLRYRRGHRVPAIGSRVWFRHAKAGELLERFDAVHLVRGERVRETVPTYRGEGRNFG